jgi:hypothetical protein
MKTTTAPIMSALPETDKALEIAVFYQDDLTHKWARQACLLPAELTHPERINITWWETLSLNHHRVFAEAVGVASTADIVTFSLYGTPESPPELLAWIDAWLPRRHQRPGALLALIGVEEHAAAAAAATREYLRAVARKAALDFITRDFLFPAKTPAKPGVNTP